MIYTSILGDRDPPRDDITVFNAYNQFTRPVLNAKIYKILSHLFVSGESIWVDGNIFPQVSEEEIFDQMAYDCDLGLFLHPARASAHEESRVLQEWKIGSPNNLIDWSAREEGRGRGLFEAGVIVRRNHERVRRFNERWWALVCRYPWRDQLTLPEALRDSGVRVHTFTWLAGEKREHPCFRYELHTG